MARRIRRGRHPEIVLLPFLWRKECRDFGFALSIQFLQGRLVLRGQWFTIFDLLVANGPFLFVETFQYAPELSLLFVRQKTEAPFVIIVYPALFETFANQIRADQFLNHLTLLLVNLLHLAGDFTRVPIVCQFFFLRLPVLQVSAMARSQSDPR